MTIYVRGDKNTPYTLLSSRYAKGGGAQVMLLTPKRVTNANQAARIVRAYFRRWQVEEEIRFDKQMWEVEDVRLMRYDKLQAMMMYTVLTAGALALLVGLHPRNAMNLARMAQIVGDVPPYPMYRVLSTVRTLLGVHKRRALRI